MCSTRLSSVLAAIGLLLAGGSDSAAQIATATLAGVVRDQTGGALSGSTICSGLTRAPITRLDALFITNTRPLALTVS